MNARPYPPAASLVPRAHNGVHFLQSGEMSRMDRPREGRMRIQGLSGVVIALLSMLGEYVVRTLNAVSAEDTYHVSERVSS